jgi:acyl carrier protein
MSPTEREVGEFILEQVQDPARRLGLDLAALDSDFDLIGSGVLDSMRFLELLTAIEQRYKIEVDLNGVEIETVTKVGGIIDLVIAVKHNG